MNASKRNFASNKLTASYDILRTYVLYTEWNNPIDEITLSYTLQFMVTFNIAVKNIKVIDLESVSKVAFSINTVWVQESTFVQFKIIWEWFHFKRATVTSSINSDDLFFTMILL